MRSQTDNATRPEEEYFIWEMRIYWIKNAFLSLGAFSMIMQLNLTERAITEYIFTVLYAN
jgi:hypothetical protein